MRQSFSWYRNLCLSIVLALIGLQGMASADECKDAASKQIQKSKSQPKIVHHPSKTCDKDGKEHSSPKKQSKLDQLSARVKALKELAYEAHLKKLFEVEKDLIAKAHCTQLILARERKLQAHRDKMEQMRAEHAELLKKAQYFEREYSRTAIMANQLAKKIEEAARQMQAELAGPRPQSIAPPCPKCVGPCCCPRMKGSTGPRVPNQ